jgi:hypothetical protein
MTNEQQKIALLEWAGWRRKIIVLNGPLCWHDPEGKPKAWLDQDYLLPNLDSLDVLATFEEKMAEQDGLLCIDYVNHLLQLPGGGRASRYGLVHATAAQRLEALVRALGLWRE